MPQNRRSRDRAEKRGEIVAAARELFISDGFPDVSVARIARAAGVTSTTVYWYFTDKDALLVAVLDDLLETSLGELEDLGEMSLEDKFLWTAARLTALGALVDTVHTRRMSSTVVDEWHDGFHALADTMTRASLPAGMSDVRADALCRVAAFVVEGIISHRPPESVVREMAGVVAAAVDAAG